MELEPADGMPWNEWNEAIASFDTAMLYHNAAWLAFLEGSGRGRPVRFRIFEDGEIAGYFVALLVRKGPFRVLGSPLSGSMSEYMGPVVDRNFDGERFLRALDRTCREGGIHHVEIGSSLLDPEDMAAHGYEKSKWMTFRIPLSMETDEMWRSLTSKCRNRVRKGLKHTLAVQDARDPCFVDRHYRQLEEVFGRHGRPPPFAIDELRSLVNELALQDLVFTLQVEQEATKDVVATGIFPHDEERVYALSTASRINVRHLCPNELLHWGVMQRAGRKGIQDYTIGDDYRIPKSGGRFKAKFNGDYVPVLRFMKYYSPAAKHARVMYTTLHRLVERANAWRAG